MKRNRLSVIIAACAVLFAVCVVIAGVKLVSGAYKYIPDDTVKIIFDTDMNTDVDDVGALAGLHSYIREGRAELLAVVGSCNTGYTAPLIDAINTYYGLPNIPIGMSPDCPTKECQVIRNI